MNQYIFVYAYDSSLIYWVLESWSLPGRVWYSLRKPWRERKLHKTIAKSKTVMETEWENRRRLKSCLYSAEIHSRLALNLTALEHPWPTSCTYLNPFSPSRLSSRPCPFFDSFSTSVCQGLMQILSFPVSFPGWLKATTYLQFHYQSLYSVLVTTVTTKF